MDWNVALSSSLGTFAGTLVTVIGAWIIYSFEKKDIQKNNKQAEIRKISKESLDLLIKMEVYILNLHSHMNLFSKGSIRMGEDIISKSMEARLVLQMLINTITILSNLQSSDDIYNDLQDYVELVRNFMMNEININKYNDTSMNDEIDKIQKITEKLTNQIQEILHTNIDKDKFRQDTH